MKLKYLLVPAAVVLLIFAFAKTPTPSKHSYPQSNETEVQKIVQTFLKASMLKTLRLLKKLCILEFACNL